jgi:hypothetical protein
MGTNFHTPWVDGTTEYKAADMNAPLSELDAAMSYHKNTMVYCDGNITYDIDAGAGSGELSWDDYIQLAYLDSAGGTIRNKIAASSIQLTEHQFIYCDLSGTDDATITAQVATISGETGCNFDNPERIVLAVRAGGQDQLWYVNLRPTILGTIQHPYDIGGSFSGQPGAGEVILRYPFPRQVSIPAQMDDSQGVVGTAATDDNQQFPLKKDGTLFGAMVFNSGETVAWFSGEGNVTFAQGNVLTIESPDPADTTLEDVGFSIVGIRST